MATFYNSLPEKPVTYRRCHFRTFVLVCRSAEYPDKILEVWKYPKRKSPVYGTETAIS
nr:MAG TPA: hypothetical protein [Caudoviricetes sp.]